MQTAANCCPPSMSHSPSLGVLFGSFTTCAWETSANASCGVDMVNSFAFDARRVNAELRCLVRRIYSGQTVSHSVFTFSAPPLHVFPAHSRPPHSPSFSFHTAHSSFAVTIHVRLSFFFLFFPSSLSCLLYHDRAFYVLRLVVTACRCVLHTLGRMRHPLDHVHARNCPQGDQ